MNITELIELLEQNNINCEVIDGKIASLVIGSSPVMSDASAWQLIDSLNLRYVTDLSAVELTEAKRQIKDQITALREQHEYSGFTWNGYHFQSDRDSQSRIHVAFSAARGGFSDGVTWRTTDNQSVQLTAAETVQMALTLMERVESIWQASFIHKNAVNALATVEEVESYDYTANWPE